ncbi:hypothetical protein [Hathewaya limosa]|uniref:Lipoprotein n=1 Tax=Hathewaya limosa TaxID=1536 RepID=A0ABU0JT03_HATLI|nr:hypothetical protein [Hathewaya limosa]MDQ0479288.1 hypothetical protein [Hathewaya limosa]
MRKKYNLRNKVLIFLLISIFLTLLSGCSTNIELSEKEKILAPSNEKIPITGIWKIESYKNWNSKITEKELKRILKNKIEFNEDVVRVGKEVCNNPQFKIKTVDADQYLIYAYKRTRQELQIKNKNLNIISVTSNEKHFYDFMEIDSDNMILYAYDTFLYLKKVSENEIKNSNRKETNGNTEQFSKIHKDEKELLRSTLVLGLRSENKIKVPLDNDTKKEIVSQKYRTFTIYSRNKKIENVIETDKILIPRNIGFWGLNNNLYTENGKIIEELNAYNVDQKLEELNAHNVNQKFKESNIKYDQNKSYFDQLANNENLLCRVNFISDNYVGIEYDTKKNINAIKYDKFAVLPLDNFNYGKLGIWHVMSGGEEGNLQNLEKDLDKQGYKFDDTNFTLKRKNGYWAMIGRAVEKEDENRYKDYMINTIPSRGIVNYDTLNISWNDIKAKIPEARDAYTSPNKDLLVILTNKEILIYTVTSGKIAQRQSVTIPLKEGETAVMAEWATGEYALRWKKISEYNGQNKK